MASIHIKIRVKISKYLRTQPCPLNSLGPENVSLDAIVCCSPAMAAALPSYGSSCLPISNTSFEHLRIVERFYPPPVDILRHLRVEGKPNHFPTEIPPRIHARCGKQGFPSAQPYLSHTPGVTDPTSSPSVLKEENPYHHLRITVTSGGCHGFQYMMSLEAASKIDPEEDTVFEAEFSPEEGSSEAAGQAKVVMDEPSLELLYGSTVDYTMELIGSQFKIVDNPRATSNCGCGTSFDVTD
ncbi:hypothetical protein BDV27DRAFT_144043 [Aspergillus caelatus]|uniref:Core domain-containing protein n=2 Tax=Aspergillus subgen. Circumdati TaxID=2720871 RepID=A0A5N7A8D4_9EURO|nr:uncharacterized protein BDV27DRAFT_144043 [Aspergillus caelatus]KAE8365883.1 hypothetical protein BDV27DRAFT_144043 [Aspergillus caelatus]KAE8414955.1 hypothetical protein BDV36DRAFT_285708 [Aspergillus pseudocaelatus]